MPESRIRDEAVLKALDNLADIGMPQATAEALNKTAFEMRAAEARGVREAFDFSGVSTERFLSEGFRFDPAKASEPTVRLFALPRTAAILSDHVEGNVISAKEGDRLGISGLLAVPVARAAGGPSKALPITRGASGKVPERLKPGKIVGKGGRGFVSPRRTAILMRKGKRTWVGKGSDRRRAPIVVAYALVNQALLKARFDFFGIAEATVRREFPAKARRAIEKAVFKARASS